MSEPRAGFVAGTDKWDLLARSRMLLNVHRGEVPYFEWVRALEAVCNGCLLVTETSSDYGPLTPGEHLAASSYDTLGALSASLVVDETLRGELATAAYDYVRSKLELTSLLAPICEDLAADASRPRRTPTSWGLPTPVPSAPAPAPPALLDEVRQSEAMVRARIKELLDSETQLVRSLEALESRLLYADERYQLVETTPAWAGAHPEVTVLITSYNYAGYIGEALESVLASEGVDLELVVVDDHSSDASVEVVRAFMAEHPSLAIRLVANTANAGVGEARNTGFAAARADRVFVLDADNFVYPGALRKLSAALDADPGAAFAYGMIGQLGRDGVLSHLPWDVSRLLTGNYIDAMAMVRPSTWSLVGGYDEVASLRGWEDYEFWLRVAAAGERGAFVASPLALYRVHGLSRDRTVGLDTEWLLRYFRERYPFLPWPD